MDLLTTRETPNRDPPTPARSPKLLRRRNAPVLQDGDQQRSLFGEMSDFMLAPLLLLWPLSIAITFMIARSLADAPFDRLLAERTTTLARQVQIIDGRPLVLLPQASTEILRGEDTDRVYFQILDDQGRLLVGDRDLPRPTIYDYPEQGVVKWRTETYRDEEVRIAFTYVEAPTTDTTGSPALVQVAETMDKRVKLANEIIKGVLFPQFLLLPVAITLVWLGLARGIAPLKTMQRRIRERSPDDLSPIDPRGAPQEISPLVDAFNDLLGRLSDSIQAQKRFIADAAHQMKTPLAGLRTQAELAMRQSDPADLRRSLSNVASGSEQAARLVNQLLSLARTENARATESVRNVDVVEVVRALVGDWFTAAQARRIDLGYEGPDQVGQARIRGEPTLFREMLNNLVDNALRYTPVGGTVTIRVTVETATIVIEVEDNGPGIAPTEREMVFERFYRVLGTQVEGSGLGLAIVREIAGRHEATVEIHDPRQPVAGGAAGCRFVVRWPRA